MSNFGKTTAPVARKQHRCEWCHGPIPQGEKHKQYKGMFDDDWQNWRMHDECYDEAASGDDLDEGFAPGGGDWPERINVWWEANKPIERRAGEGETK